MPRLYIRIGSSVRQILVKLISRGDNQRMRILIAQLNPTIGDLDGNFAKIHQAIAEGRRQKAELVLFPELVTSGYPPEDFLLLPQFCQAIEERLRGVAAATQGLTAVVGTIRREPSHGEKFLRNSAAVFSNGELLGFHDKLLLPTYDVFDEMRYFDPGQEVRIFEIQGKKVGVTICEDIWQHGGAVRYTHYQHDPIRDFVSHQPDLLLNLSASPFSGSRPALRFDLCRRVCQTLHCPVVLCNQVGGNDSLIFDGNSLYVNGQGQLLAQGTGFAEQLLLIDTDAQIPPLKIPNEREADLYQALVLGLRDYFHKSGFQKACFGLSGGIDSALVACLAADALGPKNVLGVVMPSRYSSKGAMTDAMALVSRLGIDSKEISIESPFQSYLDLLEPEFQSRPFDVTEENMQARIRGMILMALSNKLGYIVLATGNKSELALGYATLYGDMCGGLGVISDLTKGQVYALSRYINRAKELIPVGILERAPSAELRPNQRDSDSLPDYDIVDTVLQEYVENHKAPEEIAKSHGYALDLVTDLIKRIHRNEYKRRQSPPGLRVSQRAFSVGRRFPIVQRWI